MNRNILVPRPSQKADVATPEVVSKQAEVVSKLADAIREVQRCPLINGFLVEDVELTFGRPVVLRHALKRPANYLVTKSNQAVIVYDMPASDRNSELWLLASGTAIVNLWIF